MLTNLWAMHLIKNASTSTKVGHSLEFGQPKPWPPISASYWSLGDQPSGSLRYLVLLPSPSVCCIPMSPGRGSIYPALVLWSHSSKSQIGPQWNEALGLGAAASAAAAGELLPSDQYQGHISFQRENLFQPILSVVLQQIYSERWPISDQQKISILFCCDYVSFRAWKL